MTISEIKEARSNRASLRSKKLGVSGIRAIFEKALTIPNVIRLEFGEPDFETPENIKEAARRAISLGRTKYTSGAGIVDLRNAISVKLERENGIYYNPLKEIVVCAGATAGIYNAFLAVLDEGDEILIPNPGWATYVHSVNLCGAIPVSYDLYASKGYCFERKIVEPLVTRRTKAILINTPSNPMGSALSKPELESVAGFAQDHDLVVLSDEVYEKFLYLGPLSSDLEHISIAKLPDMREKTVTINSFSKTYAMTGWRVGYVAANEKIADAMIKINMAANSCISSIAQYAALEALTGPQDSVAQMIETYRRRRDVMIPKLNQINGFSCKVPRGAFYAFPEVTGTGLSSFDLSMKILDEAQVATVPGSAFGSKGEGHIRLAYANSIENIELALDRISKIF
jgi:aspartate/methionine/tyrosine aminotransferase